MPREQRFPTSRRCRRECLPARYLAALRNGLGAVRIIEAENARLIDGAGQTEAGGVIGVALDLDRPPHLVLDQHAGPIAAERGGGGKITRAAGNYSLGLLDIGNPLARQHLGPADPSSMSDIEAVMSWRNRRRSGARAAIASINARRSGFEGCCTGEM